MSGFTRQAFYKGQNAYIERFVKEQNDSGRSQENQTKSTAAWRKKTSQMLNKSGIEMGRDRLFRDSACYLPM